MAEQLTTHTIYMGLAYRPLIRADGSVGRVGVQRDTPACIDPEVYPNLLTAAPVLYQMLSHIKDGLRPNSQELIEQIEMVLAFAQNGLLGIANIDDVIKGFRK